MPEQKFTSPFSIGEKVHIDGDSSIKATVVQVAFQNHVAECQVSYFSNGDLKTAWIVNWRLTPAETF